MMQLHIAPAHLPCPLPLRPTRSTNCAVTRRLVLGGGSGVLHATPERRYS